MSKIKAIAGVGVLAALVGTAIHVSQKAKDERADGAEPVLYGNVELRQVSLAFNNAERIAEVLVDEGDKVRKGQVVARLETARIKPLLVEAQARAEAQRQQLARLRNGSRPEEIAQAQANVASAQAQAADARRRYKRLASLGGAAAVSQQEIDSAQAAAEVAEAHRNALQKALDLVVAGPRQEDIAGAAAQLDALEARVALLKQQVADAELRAPTDAVVRSRLMEPGEMASPQKPVLSLAVTTPKWIRTYVGETELGRVKPGMAATVTTDSFPGKPIEGHVGYISSVAEFTPKTLQTEDLRTSLVYEVRIVIDDPDNLLRLGMPVTVNLE
jgi:HlyD family secretion protein